MWSGRPALVKPSTSQVGPYLSFRILLDYDSVPTCLSDLLLANVPLHSTPKRMLGEVEFALPELPADLCQSLHCSSSSHAVCDVIIHGELSLIVGEAVVCDEQMIAGNEGDPCAVFLLLNPPMIFLTYT